MNFIDAVKTCFAKYAVFKGVASRAEYWKFVLFNWIGLFVILALFKSPVLFELWYWGLLLPQLAAAVRRMHDIGKSGWLILVPIANVILLAMPTDRTSKYAGALDTAIAYCPACGSPLFDNGEYCSNCGAKR
jgi:uncharacterized membrane protein YhaH (DUF805 family)